MYVTSRENIGNPNISSRIDITPAIVGRNLQNLTRATIAQIARPSSTNTIIIMNANIPPAAPAPLDSEGLVEDDCGGALRL